MDKRAETQEMEKSRAAWRSLAFRLFGKASMIALAWALGGLASAADWENQPPWAASPPWPERVELDRPDPVTGAAEIYETWAYSAEFARRFINLPIEKANPDMPPGLQAVAFRIYRRQLDPGWDTRGKIYWCALDAYF